jgi:hypothetical protein
MQIHETIKTFLGYSSKHQVKILRPEFCLPELFQHINSQSYNGLVEYLRANPADVLGEHLDNSIHHLCLTASNPIFFQKAFLLLKDAGHKIHSINQRRYNPLQTLVINNLNFYGKMLEVIPFLIPDFFSSDDLPDNYSDPHPYFILMKCAINEKEKKRLLPIFFKKSNPVQFYYNFDPSKWESLKYPNSSIYKSFKNILNKQSLEQITIDLTGRKSKLFKKLVLNSVFVGDNANFCNLTLISLLAATIPEDHVIEKILNHLLEFNTANSFCSSLKIYSQNFMIESDDPQKLETTRMFKEFYTLLGWSRFLKLFVYSESFELRDTMSMVLELKNQYNININFKNFKTAKTLHDFVAKELTRINNIPYDLKQTNIDCLDNLTWNGYIISVAKTSLDLAYCGLDLNICIGSGRYAKKVLNKQCNIILIKDLSGQYFGAIQFVGKRIVEAKIKNNQRFPQNLLDWVQSQINQLEVLTEDNSQNY